MDFDPITLSGCTRCQLALSALDNWQRWKTMPLRDPEGIETCLSKIAIYEMLLSMMLDHQSIDGLSYADIRDVILKLYA